MLKPAFFQTLMRLSASCNVVLTLLSRGKLFLYITTMMGEHQRVKRNTKCYRSQYLMLATEFGKEMMYQSLPDV